MIILLEVVDGNKANSLMDEAIQYQNARNKLVNDNPNLFR